MRSGVTLSPCDPTGRPPVIAQRMWRRTCGSRRDCVPSASGPADLLVDLTAAFEALQVRWYVFGAQAALIWGRPRFTADVDATVALAGRSIPEFVKALEDRGFMSRPEATSEFISASRVLPLEHRRSTLALDLVLAGPGLEEAFLERAVLVEVSGVAVPFISPEDLIVTKILAGRDKDLDDVRGVLSERGATLDHDQIATTLRTIEVALERSDLVRVFEVERSRWRDQPG